MLVVRGLVTGADVGEPLMVGAVPGLVAAAMLVAFVIGGPYGRLAAGRVRPAMR